ncbi:site-specific integrase [Devosia sp. 1635]|uniref:tyrosine-type recombinase/integrase n=1 Tax=Devosia sp. 1635 TaxID=2726066 RepID=UPI001564B86F|nr:site-specific integrase [Devosia sp. 1635]
MPRLSKKTVDAAEAQSKEYIIWDDGFPGFGLRVFPSGKKSYVFQYRATGRTRRIAIGLHGAWTPEKALRRAVKLRDEVNDGKDPSTERHQLAADISVADLCNIYLVEGCGNKKQSTIDTDRRRIARHIRPILGHLPVRSVSKADVELFMKDVIAGRTAGDIKTRRHGLARVRGGTGTAARTLGLLGAMFTFAIGRQLRADNPVRGVTKPKDRQLDRFLTKEELARLGRVLGAPEGMSLNQSAVTIIKLLALTGCRKSEIVKLRWSEVDFETGSLRLLDSKTGPRKLPLNQAALDLLGARRRIAGNPYVFPATSGTGHFTALQKGWVTIRAAADLNDVRIHDLRHSFATTLASSGHSLLVIGSLLGHKDLRTTQIYAHLVDDAQRRASQAAAVVIQSAWRSAVATENGS